jgi:hypothetical protein
MRFAKWFTLLLLLSALFLGARYVYDKGFGKRWRSMLSKEFQRFGLQISVRRLTLDPFRGLVAKDIEIYDTKERQTVLAQISELSLDINYGNLLQQEPALNEADLRDAIISVPMDPLHPKAGIVQVSGLHSRIYFFPGRIEVRQASGDTCGIHLNGSGTLVNPAAFKFITAPDNDNDNEQDIQESFVYQLVREIKALHFSGVAPHLDFTFQVDLANLASWRLEGCRLRADAVDRSGYQLHDLEADFSLENQRLDLRRFLVHDSHGNLFGNGDWNVATGEKHFQIRSSLNLAELFGTDRRFPWVGSWKFQSPPQVEISGQWRPKLGTTVIGKLDFGQFTVSNVSFQSLTAEFSRAGDSWMITNGEVTHRSGTLSGEILNVPGDFRARINSALNPTELMPLFPPRVQSALAGWDFGTAPVIQATVRGRAPQLSELSGSGQAWLGKTKLNGSLMNSASANFKIENEMIQYDHIRITRDEGVGTGGFTYDFGKHEVSVQNASANLYPSALASWIHPAIGRFLQPFQFVVPPTLHAEGKIQFKDGSTNDLRLQFEAANPFAFQYGGLQISLDSGSGEVSVHPDRIDVDRFDGKAGAGQWSMRSEIGLSKQESRSTISLREVDTQKLGKRPGLFHGYEGKLSCDLNLRQTGLDLSGISADGTVTLNEAVVSGTRLFGPLMRELEPIGFREPVDMTMNFRLRPELFKFNSLQLLSGEHSLRLSGAILFFGGLVDLSGEYQPGGIRIRAAGTASNPRWRLGEP